MLSKITLVTVVFFCISLEGKKRVRVELNDGAVIESILLKSTDQFIFLDLDFEVLKIPQKEVSAINELNHSEPTPAFSSNEFLFTSSPNRRNSPLNELVRELGESVVMVRTPTGLGSGFLIHQDGYLVTNDHVIAGESQISVTQYRTTGKELTKINYDFVKIIATGGNLDLALLKIQAKRKGEKFPFVTLGSSPKLNQGERVFAIGSPLGLERSVSEGIVSQRNRIISDRLHVQTTAEISPGNSGGPLFNYRGQVVGVNNMKVVAQGAEGLGFAIPVDTLKNFLLNRDAYAFDPLNPNAGFRYASPPIKTKK